MERSVRRVSQHVYSDTLASEKTVFLLFLFVCFVVVFGLLNFCLFFAIMEVLLLLFLVLCMCLYHFHTLYKTLKFVSFCVNPVVADSPAYTNAHLRQNSLN